MKFQVYSSLVVGFEQQSASGGSGAGAELDEIKRMLMEYVYTFIAILCSLLTYVGPQDEPYSSDRHGGRQHAAYALRVLSFRCRRGSLEEEERVHWCFCPVCLYSMSHSSGTVTYMVLIVRSSRMCSYKSLSSSTFWITMRYEGILFYTFQRS